VRTDLSIEVVVCVCIVCVCVCLCCFRRHNMIMDVPCHAAPGLMAQLRAWGLERGFLASDCKLPSKAPTPSASYSLCLPAGI
jgi:hypothetical protein